MGRFASCVGVLSVVAIACGCGGPVAHVKSSNVSKSAVAHKPEASSRRESAAGPAKSDAASVAHKDDSSSASGRSGIASVYSATRTANGETPSAGALTAAHPSLPFGTMVRVTNKNNGRTVVVRINDRGPFINGRVIDMNKAAAEALGFRGLAPVKLEVVSEKRT
jgi:rare lipoprotein A